MWHSTKRWHQCAFGNHARRKFTLRLAAGLTRKTLVDPVLPLATTRKAEKPAPAKSKRVEKTTLSSRGVARRCLVFVQCRSRRCPSTSGVAKPFKEGCADYNLGSCALSAKDCAQQHRCAAMKLSSGRVCAGHHPTSECKQRGYFLPASYNIPAEREELPRKGRCEAKAKAAAGGARPAEPAAPFGAQAAEGTDGTTSATRSDNHWIAGCLLMTLQADAKCSTSAWQMELKEDFLNSS